MAGSAQTGQNLGAPSRQQAAAVGPPTTLALDRQVNLSLQLKDLFVLLSQDPLQLFDVFVQVSSSGFAVVL